VTEREVAFASLFFYVRIRARFFPIYVCNDVITVLKTALFCSVSVSTNNLIPNT